MRRRLHLQHEGDGEGERMTNARPASALLAAIGLNVHLDQPAYAPDGTYAALQSALAGLWPNGGGNLRLSSAPVVAQGPGSQATFVNMNAAEYDYVLTPNVNDGPTATQAFYNLCPSAMAAIEGLNEPDQNKIPNGETLAFQMMLENEQSEIIPGYILGPSITTLSYAQAQGDLSDYLDAGNVHFYTAGHQPENGGYGSGGYGSLAYTLNIGAQTAPHKPCWITECGFAGPSAAPQYGPLDENTRAQYYLRAILFAFRSGVPRVYLYELVTSNAAEQYGLVSSLSPLAVTPSYTAVAGLIALFADATHYDEPQVNVTVTAPPGIAVLVFRKTTGALVIAMWNVNVGLPVAETVTVTASGYATTAKGSWFWNGAWASEPVLFNGGVATMGVGGAPFFLEVTV